MSCEKDRPVVVRSAETPARPARRPGLTERRLLTPAESPHQNLVLVEAQPGVEVELHGVPNSESFYLLEGVLEIFGAGWRERLAAGDVCHFPPGVEHGVQVGATGARFLIVFAPAHVP